MTRKILSIDRTLEELCFKVTYKVDDEPYPWRVSKFEHLSEVFKEFSDIPHKEIKSIEIRV